MKSSMIVVTALTDRWTIDSRGSLSCRVYVGRTRLIAHGSPLALRCTPPARPVSARLTLVHLRSGWQVLNARLLEVCP